MPHNIESKNDLTDCYILAGSVWFLSSLGLCIFKNCNAAVKWVSMLSSTLYYCSWEYGNTHMVSSSVTKKATWICNWLKWNNCKLKKEKVIKRFWLILKSSQSGWISFLYIFQPFKVRYCHSHRKQNNTLETRAVLLIFSHELEISGVAKQSIHQNSKKWRLLWGIYQ